MIEKERMKSAHLAEELDNDGKKNRRRSEYGVADGGDAGNDRNKESPELAEGDGNGGAEGGMNGEKRKLHTYK